MKNRKTLMVTLTLCLVTCFIIPVFAAHVVKGYRIAWDHVHTYYSSTSIPNDYDENERYTDFTYVHGYTEQETTKNTTSFSDVLMHSTRIHHQIAIKTY